MTGNPRLRGSIVALVTPFSADGKTVDEGALTELIEWHIAEGTDGFVPCGTTGESATLSHAEHKRVIELTVETVKGRVPVIAGAGSNSTAEAIELARHAEKVGADYVLSITPYYNKPTQDGLVAHFTAVADALTKTPVVMYNVPGRTGVNMLPATTARAARHPRIVAVKEACGDLRQISEVIEACPADFTLLSGDDFTILPTLSVGGKGVISVIANIAPRLCAEMIAAWEKGDAERARAIQRDLLPLCRACFVETSPSPVKAGVALLGRCRNVVRLPLLAAGDKAVALIKESIVKLA